jgi:hypothetical protein
MQPAFAVSLSFVYAPSFILNPLLTAHKNGLKAKPK